MTPVAVENTGIAVAGVLVVVEAVAAGVDIEAAALVLAAASYPAVEEVAAAAVDSAASCLVAVAEHMPEPIERQTTPLAAAAAAPGVASVERKHPFHETGTEGLVVAAVVAEAWAMVDLAVVAAGSFGRNSAAAAASYLVVEEAASCLAAVGARWRRLEPIERQTNQRVLLHHHLLPCFLTARMPACCLVVVAADVAAAAEVCPSPIAASFHFGCC